MSDSKKDSAYTVFNAVDARVSKPVLGSDGAAAWQNFRSDTKQPQQISSCGWQCRSDGAPESGGSRRRLYFVEGGTAERSGGAAGGGRGGRERRLHAV